MIVEVVGPAGAGKTSLTQMLARECPGIAAGAPPYYRRMDSLPFFAANGLRLLPELLRLGRCDAGLPPRRELAWMMILQGWHRDLIRQGHNGTEGIVLDQGPIYLLAQLHDFGSRRLRHPCAQPWQAAMVAQWAATLDTIVYLDARDSTLLQRIDGRGGWWMAESLSQTEVVQLLNTWRNAYTHVLDQFALQANGPVLLPFSTESNSLDSIAVVLQNWFARFGRVRQKRANHPAVGERELDNSRQAEEAMPQP